jgi:hypothetical protein
MRIRIVLIIVLLCLALGTCAFAKDFGSMPSVDVGAIWIFMLDNMAEEITVDPTGTYGFSYVQAVAFKGARNMAFELSYHHSESRGLWDPLSGEDWQFDLKLDYSTVNVSYYFTGRRIHPYLSGGVGAAFIKYHRFNNEKIWEVDPAINIGAGVDFTVFEPKGGMNQFNLGFRVRYIFMSSQEIVDSGLSALTAIVRVQTRF